MKRYIFFLILSFSLFGCTKSGYRADSLMDKCYQVDSFEYYYIDEYCPPLLSLGLENPHGSFIRINWEFPSLCADTVVLDSIQRVLCTDIHNVYPGACYDSLNGGLCLDTGCYVPHKSSVLIPPTFSLEETNDWAEKDGFYNTWRASVLSTLCNKDGVYSAKHQYNIFELGACHNWYGTEYFTFRLSDGHRLYLQDILTNGQLYRLTAYLVNKYEVDGINYRYGLDPDSIFIPFGICDSALVLHFNAGVLNCWASGEYAEVIPCNGNRIISAIVSGRIDTTYMDSILPVSDIDYHWSYKYAIRDLTEAILSDNKRAVAEQTIYPFWQPYPLPIIESPEEFVRHYNRIVPKGIKEKLRTSTYKDWSQMGWRGLMFDNGQIWLDDYAHLRSIGDTDSKSENQDLENLRVKERKLLGLPPSAIPEFCYVDTTATTMVYVYRDSILSDPSDWHKSGHRVRLYHRGTSLLEPYFEASAMYTIEGSCGNEVYVAQTDSMTVVVFNGDCGFREREHAYSFISYPTSQNYTTWDDFEDDNYFANPYTRCDDMCYSYLWQVAAWW